MSLKVHESRINLVYVIKNDADENKPILVAKTANSIMASKEFQNGQYNHKLAFHS